MTNLFQSVQLEFQDLFQSSESEFPLMEIDLDLIMTGS